MTRFLKINITGRLIDLLGKQMYGGIVPSVAELIANAWDADAPKVEVTIPENPTATNAAVIVKDCGHGMTFEEINKYYLHVGYERRKKQGEHSLGGRLVMGRKGIGKLAGFGIAENIIIHSVKKHHLVEFVLNHKELTQKEDVHDHQFEPVKDVPTTETDGVTIIYEGLKIGHKINIKDFRTSMGRRFALQSTQMLILINGKPLSPEDFDFEYREPDPDKGWQKEEIPGFGKVEYWFGFLKEPIKDPELRGISVFARDRVAQFTPFFFNLSGGINGQVGLEYLTGQVKCDALDETVDYVATDRQTVNWQFGQAPLLEKWGKEKIKKLCAGWKKRQDEKKGDKFIHNYSKFAPLIKGLPSQERQDLIAALTKVSKLERIGVSEFETIASAMISGVQRKSIQKIIKKINSADEDSLEQLYEVMRDWDIVTAVQIAETVKGKIEIIKQFKSHIKNRLPEKSGRETIDMQTFIKQYPWLLGNDYEKINPKDIYHEKEVDAWIKTVLKEADPEYGPENRRFDLLVIKDRREICVLELMRPGEPADYNHLMRLNLYVKRIQTAINKRSTDSEFANILVTGKLIADKFANDGSILLTLADLKPKIHATEWNTLFDNVAGRYKEYYTYLSGKAPNDPRIKALDEIDE